MEFENSNENSQNVSVKTDYGRQKKSREAGIITCISAFF